MGSGTRHGASARSSTRGHSASAPNIPLTPLQGALGVAPPGPHGGNLDLRELAEGSTLYLTVRKPGALIYSGDSHAVQGDGQISLAALETRMQEVLIQVVLHSAASRRASG